MVLYIYLAGSPTHKLCRMIHSSWLPVAYKLITTLAVPAFDHQCLLIKIPSSHSLVLPCHTYA